MFCSPLRNIALLAKNFAFPRKNVYVLLRNLAFAQRAQKALRTNAKFLEGTHSFCERMQSFSRQRKSIDFHYILFPPTCPFRGSIPCRPQFENSIQLEEHCTWQIKVFDGSITSISSHGLWIEAAQVVISRVYGSPVTAEVVRVRQRSGCFLIHQLRHTETAWSFWTLNHAPFLTTNRKSSPCCRISAHPNVISADCFIDIVFRKQS